MIRRMICLHCCVGSIPIPLPRVGFLPQGIFISWNSSVSRTSFCVFLPSNQPAEPCAFLFCFCRDSQCSSGSRQPSCSSSLASLFRAAPSTWSPLSPQPSSTKKPPHSRCILSILSTFLQQARPCFLCFLGRHCYPLLELMIHLFCQFRGCWCLVGWARSCCFKSKTLQY